MSSEFWGEIILEIVKESTSYENSSQQSEKIKNLINDTKPPVSQESHQFVRVFATHLKISATRNLPLYYETKKGIRKNTMRYLDSELRVIKLEK